MEKRFYSNGKLLITGEYLVLDGAKALALPTKFGQDLRISLSDSEQLSWKSFDANNSIWFEDSIPFSELVSKAPLEDNSIRTTLIRILRAAYALNPQTIDGSSGYQISTNLSFPKHWGLGTSSTLINNIAQWFGIDAYTLLQNSFGGSGYDIACAQNNNPLLYQLRQATAVVEKVEFRPSFRHHIYFVYLNNKQNSKTAIAAYREKQGTWQKEISKVNALSLQVLEAKDLDSMALALQQHEKLLSSVLQTKTIKERLFPEFEGSIKSLGAWGGDFVMVLSKKDPRSYFQSKAYNTIITYDDMIL